MADGLTLPSIGDYGLRVLSPTILELTLINTKDNATGRVQNWDFVSEGYSVTPPAANSFAVTANGQAVGIVSVGFKRRPIYAPVRQRDLRIANHLYLQLSVPLADGTLVEVKNPAGNLWHAPAQFIARNEALRFNPALHVNEVGYMPTGPKKAMVGYFIGSLGEMDIPLSNGFKIVNATSGSVAFTGSLTRRDDVGFQYAPAPYQKVYEADFTSFTTPGEYRLQVPGLGVSYPFRINEGVAATFARTFALGLYHQRCGAELDAPFTRHDHGFCHTNVAEIPTMTVPFEFTQAKIKEKSSDYWREPRHAAPQMVSTATSLYPFVRQGKIDVSKGHHDAGDYSKYTINSAGLIHHLVFAADSFAGAGDLDNLGIPESGDGKSDLLQEAKWEADFLAKMQDSDGGFYFLVYPKNREYENDVTPDHGDAQVVWPKTTAVTAAATAALAEIGSSPRFRQQFPIESAAFLAKAQLGWDFLMRAIAKYGKDGSYQKITHYGHEFIHDDELAWAASAMYAATGNGAYFAKLKEWLPNPNAPSTQRWGWWRMFEGYGCAIRTYAFAGRSGRISPLVLDSSYLTNCQNEVIATADDITRFSRQTSYGTSFGDPYKKDRSAGWYFSSERAFEITVGYQLSRKPEYKEAVFANVNYEAGCNPVNVAYVTGLGWKRQREIVNQASQNDRQVLPPSGMLLGNVQAGFPFLDNYTNELTRFTFPADQIGYAPYPYYERWGDTYDTTCEAVVVDQARSLGSLAYWMAQSGMATQIWKPGAAQIVGLPASLPAESSATVSLVAPGLDLNGAQIVWEMKSLEPFMGPQFTFAPKFSGLTWIEAEALLSDGRRVSVRTNFLATTAASTPPNPYQSAPVASGPDTAAIYHFDNSLADSSGRQGALVLSGAAAMDPSNLGWLANRSGAALRMNDLKDHASVSIPAASMVAPGVTYISVEAMIYMNGWKAYNRDHAWILSLYQNENAQLELRENMYSGPIVSGGSVFRYQGDPLKNAIRLNEWHHLSIRVDKTGYTLKLNGNVIASLASDEVARWNPNGGPIKLQFGDFDGWIDEVVVRSSTLSAVNKAPTVSLNASASTAMAPATIDLAATASDSDGTIAKVEFYRGTTKISEDTSAPFTCSSPGLAAGSYAFSARAIDNAGAMASSAPVNVTVTGSGAGDSGTAAASFVGIDTTTKGNWAGAYGSQGYTIVNQGEVAPAYGTLTLTGQQNYTWSASTTELRALLKPGRTDRIAAVWFSPYSFDMQLGFTDTNTHRVAVYVMDWDNSGRVEQFEVVNADDNSVLCTTEVSDFAQGKYVIWDVRGNVALRVSHLAGNNAIVEGVFFDAAPQPKSPRLKILGANTQGLQIEISGESGVVGRIESSGDMKSWRTAGQVSLTTTPTIFTDATTKGQQGLRFYRVAP